MRAFPALRHNLTRHSARDTGPHSRTPAPRPRGGSEPDNPEQEKLARAAPGKHNVYSPRRAMEQAPEPPVTV